ncbi:MAG: hypothetical protein HZC05_00155 [Candidatus Magasanikbacteria bacterium]|nr:hypothetical protein [Candidatus Magasanikbacteria bacterium]
MDRVSQIIATNHKEKIMKNVHVINDCQDENARLRQMARYGAYFPGTNIIFAGVSSDLEAAFMLVDTIDALDGHTGVITVNVAPRNGEAKKYANGTPFGKVQVEDITIFASIDGATLRLLNKVRSSLQLCVYDIPEVVHYLTPDKNIQKHITLTQFRSFEFLPRLAKAVVLQGVTLSGHHMSLADYCGDDALGAIACVDCFGNLKTTLLPEEVGFEPGKSMELKVNGSLVNVKGYLRLKDIPDGELGLTIGSSGLGFQRFLELVCQGGDAGRRLSASVGTLIHLAK